ncbi:Serine/threonine protein phosphatase PrpC [Roseateles sp. YR242]|uniref:PP2C family protein-serine/threonine phosphatase n=1 Tax=Roseateles sp. YR242 TaxID=1855305 RepID=UPI0008B38A9E|nr:protein phosphatase 2C domain-containing protein [Roseateles sp. YR242]SEL55622.1 Serine/threonine protein phosphatase PrpC [Roseateles sp. YR242]
MSRTPPGYRLSAATGIHRGDRLYQQDQVQVFPHPRQSGWVLGIVADGMGGKSGGRKAADQVILTAQQLFERFVPDEEDEIDLLRQIVSESHLMIRLTAISAEEEPHSTLAAYLLTADRRCFWIHTGDSRIYHFRGPNMVTRSLDQSYVQRLVDEGQITEEEAQVHPQSNLLTACLGTVQEPTPVEKYIERVETGDSLMCCSDGLWHYFTPAELGTVLHSLPPRDGAELLVSKARQRAKGTGDNLSLAVVRLEPLDE